MYFFTFDSLNDFFFTMPLGYNEGIIIAVVIVFYSEEIMLLLSSLNC
ncbi:unnamed protein product [Nezara viridula]|uniref:Uncharacterized protein n=1 Tax=Nezara viridula TaxID=85310 RepID=A0A9P0DWQ9_NEZVI|nr:unnamed protein product [Nezara viridula]